MTARPTPADVPPLSGLFLAVACVFITALLAANVIAVKIIAPFDWVVPAGIVIFPVSYILGDVLTEVYGIVRARQVILLGFICNLLFVLAVLAGGSIPAAPFWQGQEAYDEILGYTPRLLAASFAGYLVGELSNSLVLVRLKAATEGRWLWLRTIGSTFIGQGLDSLIFGVIAFAGTVPDSALREIVWHNWVLKTAYEALATPLTYVVVSRLKRLEGLEDDGRRSTARPASSPSS